MRTPCGPRNSPPHLAVSWEGRLGYRIPNKSLQLIEHQVVATKSLRSWPLRPALKGAQMDVKFHSEICTQHTMIEVMNHIKVLLKLTGKSEYFLFQDDEYVTAMNSIPPGEIMGRVHMADRSDKAPATKGIDTWKDYPANQFQGYNHVPNDCAIRL